MSNVSKTDTSPLVLLRKEDEKSTKICEHGRLPASTMIETVISIRFSFRLFSRPCIFLDFRTALPHHVRLCELTTGSTWHCVDALGHVHEVGVEISVESLGVGLNLRQSETDTSVDWGTSRVVGQTSGEWSGHATDRHAVVLASNRLWVGECKSWWTGHALDTSVNVSGSASGRRVFATDVVEADVVADGLELSVDTEVVESHGAWQTASEGVVRIDNLAWNSLDSVGAGEWDRESLGTLGVALGVTVLCCC